MVEELLSWYDRCKRDLPWRKNRDPYRIWISEIMCQQTRIDTVIPYYHRFMETFPTVSDLASADEAVLLKVWQGLGYYSRARNLKKAAIVIQQQYQGVFPKDYEAVRRLPGIGDYTASAILSMAYDQKYASVDGNFLRVFSRLWCDGSDISISSTKKAYQKRIEEILPQRSGDFNQAIMDIGATICLANDLPLCDRCPLRTSCRAFAEHCVLSYPVKGKKTAKEETLWTVFLVEQEKKLLLHRRPEEGLLAGLYELKTMPGFLSEEQIRHVFKDSLVSFEKGPTKQHIFTHKKWRMQSYFVQVKNYCLEENECWATKEEIDTRYSIPKAFLQFL